MSDLMKVEFIPLNRINMLARPYEKHSEVALLTDRGLQADGKFFFLSLIMFNWSFQKLNTVSEPSICKTGALLLYYKVISTSIVRIPQENFRKKDFTQ